jgi:predicted transcriptional regulator
MESEHGATGAAGPGPINPAALTVAQAARLLGVAEQTVRDHVAAGAPAAADGTINLVHYVAWMNKQLAGTDAD